MSGPANRGFEYALLGLLALLWGSSYLFLKVAVAEIPPVTLIAFRVTAAAAFLAWGQQYVDSSLASVLNSTSPIFVFLFTYFVTRHEALSPMKLLGAILGLAGVVLIVGTDALQGLGQHVAGQLAAVAGAILYACAAVYGKRLAHVSATATATGAMIWAAVVLVPASLALEQPWTTLPMPSMTAILAASVLAIFCTAGALLIYFRLIQTLGSLGVASQAYLRAGVGVALGMIFFGEQITLIMGLGLVTAILGVAAINMPQRAKRAV